MFRSANLRRSALQLVSLVTFAVAAFVGAAFVGAAFAQDQGQAPDMTAMMEAMTPGPHHEQMATHAGSWKTTSKMWMEPGQPPTETSGIATIEVLMDGRFVHEITKANMMGMPWEGRGVFGFDNSSQKHIGSWFDSFGTTIMNFEGTCDGTCNVVTLQSTYFDPTSKSTKTMKSVSTVKSDDHHLMELFDVAEDGTESKIVEITYTRDKGEKGQTKR